MFNESAYGNSIIQSMLDTDYYTFTMMQAVLHQHPNVDVEYDFIVRSKESLVPYIKEIREEIERLGTLSFSEDELRFLSSPTRDYLTPDFIRFLGLFQFNIKYVMIRAEKGQLRIRVRGPWLHTIMFEQPLLAAISEIRNRKVYPDVKLSDVRKQLYKKFDWLVANASEEEMRAISITDFGTRRRLSFHAHKEVLEVMSKDFPGHFAGTSNVHMGRELDLPVVGTMAHQWLMAYQQFGRLKMSQREALEGWIKEYRGRLGVALTDCISSDFFLSEFDLYFAKLFDGLRHDSGDPVEWAEKCIRKYQSLGIDPMSRKLVFSDGLSFPKALEISRAINGRIKYSFGIGTNLCNDVPGVEPLSIVMKLVSVNNAPVVKFSDDPIKVVCNDPSFLEYAKTTFGVE